MPRSELAKYPQPKFPSEQPPPNPVREQTAPSGFTGFDAATSKENPADRQANSRTFDNADGTQTTELGQSPMNYQRADGSWHPIDTTLVAADKDWRNAADQVEIRFSATASEPPFVRMRLSGEHEVAFGLAGTAASQGRVAGSRIVYPRVARDSDLQIDVLPGGVKETLVLASPEAPHSWVFPLHLKGLTARIVGDHVSLTDSAGQERAQIPAGFMTDGHPENPSTSYGVRYEIVPHGGGQALKMSLDSGWLRDKARTYPVLVDPSVHGVVANAAVTTSGGAMSGGTELQVGNGRVMYVKFDGVKPALGNHKIFGAQLYLTSFDAPSCRPEPITVHPVTSAWSPGGSGHPATGGVIGAAAFANGYVALGQSHSACPTAAHSIDLGDAGRDLVQGWVRDQANNGLAVKAVSSWKKFTGTGTANPPRLFVTHTPYDASYRIERGVPEPPVHRQQDGFVRIAVTNRGSQTWTPGAFKLAYRAFTAQGHAVTSRESAPLPRNVPPGDTITLDAKVFRFANPGDYLLDFSMVHNSTYFTDEQIPPARLSMTMFEIPPIVKAQYPPAGHSSPTLRTQLWADAVDVDAPPNTGVLYEFEVCRSKDDGSPDLTTCRLTPRAPSKTATVPAGWLDWSETYHWRAFAVDPSGTRSEALPFSALLTAVPQPDITSHLGGAPYSANDLDFDPQIGNYTTGAVDAALGVTGPELSVSRTYNSLDPRKDSLFGAGWSTRYDMKVVPDLDGSGNVVVTYPDGQAVRFGRNAADGSFDPPPGRFATFYQDIHRPERPYVLVDKSNTVYTFREFDGRLITIRDNAGRLVELDYLLDGKIRRAISRTSTNRTLYFTWTGNHVTEVRTDPPVAGGTPIKWTYHYAGDRLTKVCDPKNGCTTYDYDLGSHYRSAVVDSKPDSYWRLGEPSGDQAVSQVATNLGKDWGAHRNVQLGAPGALDSSPDTAATFNGTNSYVKLPDGAVKKSRDLSVELWFKTTSGGPLIGIQRAPFDRDPIGAVPVLYVDRDGKLRGQFWHGRIAPITSGAAVNDGQWHHVVLSGSLATQTLFLDGAKVGTSTGEIDLSLFNYGQIGASHAVGPADWEPHGWWPGQRVKHFAGQIDEVAIYQHPLGEEAARSHFRSRAAADQLTKVTMPSGRVAAQLVYDAVNDRIREYTDEDGGLWKLGVPQVSGTETQDTQGRTVRNLVRSIQVTDPGNRSHFYDYDPVKGRIIRFVAPLGVGVRLEDRPDPSIVPTPPTSAPPCDPPPPPNPDGSPGYCGGVGGSDPNWQGGPVQGVGVRTYDYDSSGFQNTISDENGHQVVLKHDDRGNIESRTTCREPGVCDTEHFTYHKPAPGNVNNTDPRIDKQLTARDGRSSGPADNRFLTTSVYNLLGELSRQTFPDGTFVEHSYTDGTTAAEGGGNEPAGLLKWTKDARGKQTDYRYFANGDLASATEPGPNAGESGLVTKYKYDLLGRKISETEFSDSYPQGLETKFVYDERNKPVEVTDAPVTNAVTGVKHTKHTRTTFNADGLPDKVEVSDLTGGDPARTTLYTYDDKGRQDSVTDAEGAKTTYGFDVFGNRTWVVDAHGTRIEYAYTARNKVAEVRLRGWHGKPVSGGVGEGEAPTDGSLLVLEANTYDLGGRVIRHVDAMGRKTIYEYTPSGLVFRVFAEVPVPNAAPRRVLLEQNTYDGAGNLEKKIGPGGKVTQYTINPAGRVAESLEDPTGLARRTGYQYDANGNVTQVARSGKGSNTGVTTDLGTVIDYTYDNVGNQTSETIQFGTSPLKTTRKYDKRGVQIAETDPRGNVAGADPAAFTTEIRYDENERQVGIKMPAVAVERDGGAPVVSRPETLTGFNNFGDEVAVKDANGNVTKRFYDKVGRPVRTETPDYLAPGSTQPIKGVTQTKYDAVGNPIEVVNERGAVVRYRYDQLGRMVERQDPRADDGTAVGGVWKYTYTHNGEQLSATDPTGARSEATYDALGRKVTETQIERKPTANSFTTKLEYNDAGELLIVTSPSQEITKFTYDALGQRITAVDPANVAMQFGYDGAGNQAWQRDALGRTSYLKYDTAGRLTGQFSLNGQNQILRRTTYTHDLAGNVLTAVDAMNRTARYGYDALNRLTQQIEPVSDSESITTSFGYDANGQRTRYTDGRNNKFVYTYNSLSLPENVIEPSTVAHPNAADRTWTSIYDAAGNPTRLTAPGNVMRDRQYDALSRLIKETGSGAEVGTTERSRAYDTAGRLKEIDSPGGRQVFDYNDRNAVLTSSGPSGNSSFTYDDDGRVAARTDASGTANFTYAQGRLTATTDSVTGTAQTFGYNEAGQLKQIKYGSTRTRDITYDTLGRQASDVVKDVSSVTYEYDNNDRLTRKVTTGLAGAGDNTYTYDYANRLKSWTVGGVTTEYAWDASGNRTRNGAKTAAYDERNRLLSDGDYTYKYTARGTTASRTSSGLEEKFSFDAFDRLIEFGQAKYAYDGADRLVSHNGNAFRYAGFDIDPVSDGNTLFGRGASGELLSVGQGTTKRLTLSDKHGDVIAAMDPAATALADSTAYSPFGVVTAGAKRPAGYQGDWTDPESGQVNMGARWYQPGTGTFASRDTVSADSGASILFNRYTYGAGRPLDMIDPDGHWPNWGAIWNGVKKATKVVVNVVKEVSGYNDIANFIRNPSWSNFFWAASNFIPFGKVAKGVKYLARWGDDGASAARRGSRARGGSRAGRQSDDFASAGRRYGDDLASAGRRNVADYAKTAAQAAARRAAAAAAAAAAARRAAMEAVTRRAKAAIAYAAKNNPLSVLQAALKPRIALKDLISSAPNLPARQVSALAENVQDVNKVWETVKATVIKPGTSVVQAVGEQVVSDFANSQIPGLGDFLSLLGPSRKRGDHAAKDSGTQSRDSVSTPAADKASTTSCERHSFPPGTLVLLADGTRKPIEQVQQGDVVLAANPGTGTVEARPVVATWVHDNEPDRTELTLDTDGVSGDATATISATDWHPIWVADLKAWVPIANIKAGSWLQTAAGTWIQVTAVRDAIGTGKAYDLTVDTTHTYHVAVGNTSLLVHNCGDDTIDPATVRFSQSGVSPNFKNGNSIDSTAEALSKGDINPADFPAMRLVERDGHLYTLDNRRLAAFQKAGLSEVPFRMATRREIDRESWKFDPDTDGTSIRIRRGGGVWRP